MRDENRHTLGLNHENARPQLGALTGSVQLKVVGLYKLMHAQDESPAQRSAEMY